jgi:glutaredoxin 3
MANVEIYSSRLCGFCSAAQRLLERKGAELIVHWVDGKPDVRRAMIERAGGRYTVPQIFIDDRHIGGFDDLSALDREGGLDPLLGR